ncbi:hypothetical protein BH09SUM1_BH09SUM1_28570 [soil metagenome]
MTEDKTWLDFVTASNGSIQSGRHVELIWDLPPLLQVISSWPKGKNIPVLPHGETDPLTLAQYLTKARNFRVSHEDGGIRINAEFPGTQIVLIDALLEKNGFHRLLSLTLQTPDEMREAMTFQYAEDQIAPTKIGYLSEKYEKEKQSWSELGSGTKTIKQEPLGTRAIHDLRFDTGKSVYGMDTKKLYRVKKDGTLEEPRGTLNQMRRAIAP